MRTMVQKGWFVALLACLMWVGGGLTAAEEPKPLSLDAILKMKAAEVEEADIGGLVEKRGVDFVYGAETAEKLINAGCGIDLMKRIRAAAQKNKAAKPDAPPPAAEENTPATRGPSRTFPLPDNDDTGLGGAVDDDPLPPKFERKPAATPAEDDDPLPPAQPRNPQGDGSKDSKSAVQPKTPPPNPFKRADVADGLDKTTEAAPELIYGPRIADEKQNAIEQFFKDILKNSGLQLQVHQSKHVTLICSAANAQKFLPDMKALELKLEQRFPGNMKIGPDKRSAILVLVDNQADYKAWITAEYTAFKLDKGPADGQGGANPMQMALNARGSFFPFAGVQDLSAMQNDQDRKKSVAYAVGYLWMHALTEGHAPDCFITGFGNYCEAIMYTDPMTRVYSYEERQIAAGPRVTWVNQMKDQIAKKEASSSDDVIGFSTVTMKSVNYVEAWSFISFLATRPTEFDKVVTALRDKNGTMKAIQAYFKYDNKNLEYYWKNWANTQN